MPDDLALHVATVGARMTRAAPGEAARLFEELALGAAAGHASVENDLLACGLWLAQRGPGDSWVADALAAARAGGLRVAELLLDEVAPHRALSARGRRQHQGLGAMHSLALAAPLGRPNMHLRPGLNEQLSIMNVHADPAFTRRLLDRPGLTLDHVVRMAGRRPTTAELLTEIAMSLRWARHAKVREALVFNPFTPTAVAARYLPTLPLLRRARVAAGLHPHVRELACTLLAAGPTIEARQLRAARASGASP